MKKNILILFGLGVLFFSSCLHSPIISPNQVQVSFKNEVQPIIIGNCTASGCHGNTGSGGESFSLMTYDDVITFGGLTTTKPEKTRLYQSLLGNSENAMPPAGPLADSQIQTIYNWISQGAKNN